MSALTHAQRTLKTDLLGKEMSRLDRALSDSDEDHVLQRVHFITSRLKRLPGDHQQEVLTTMKEHIDTFCADETLKSRLLSQLDGHATAA